MNSIKIRKILLIIGVVIITLALMLWFDISYSPSRKIAQIGDALSNASVEKLGNYFGSDSKIIYKGNSYNFQQVKTNIENVFNSHQIRIVKDAFYGHTTKKGMNKSFAIAIGWIEVGKEGTKEMDVKITFQRKGLSDWEVTEFISNDNVFGHIFVSSKIKP